METGKYALIGSAVLLAGGIAWFATRSGTTTTGRVVALGEVGEICARGYQQFVGYLHDERATDKAHDADGFVRTGDLGSMDERGYLRVAGRLKELIIRGGENVSPVDVEEALRDHPAVDGVAVVGLPDERLGEIVAAVLIVNGSDPELRESLLEHSRNRLAPFKIPARWFVADSFPLTPGFTCAAVIIRAWPAQATMMSAWRHTSIMSSLLVREWARVTVQSMPLRPSSNTCGNPVRVLRPMTVARLPAVATPYRSSNRITPSNSDRHNHSDTCASHNDTHRAE